MNMDPAIKHTAIQILLSFPHRNKDEVCSDDGRCGAEIRICKNLIKFSTHRIHVCILDRDALTKSSHKSVNHVVCLALIVVIKKTLQQCHSDIGRRLDLSSLR